MAQSMIGLGERPASHCRSAPRHSAELRSRKGHGRHSGTIHSCTVGTFKVTDSQWKPKPNSKPEHVRIEGLPRSTSKSLQARAFTFPDSRTDRMGSHDVGKHTESELLVGNQALGEAWTKILNRAIPGLILNTRSPPRCPKPCPRL